MMKRVAVCVIFLLTVTSASAEIEEFRYFSLDVPEGWSAKESGDVVSVTADDRSGSLVITSGNPGGESITALALKLSHEMRGTEPVSDDEGDYTFEYNNGVSHVTVTGDEDFYMVITASGFVRNAETLGEILASLEMR